MRRDVARETTDGPRSARARERRTEKTGGEDGARATSAPNTSVRGALTTAYEISGGDREGKGKTAHVWGKKCGKHVYIFPQHVYKNFLDFLCFSMSVKE